jgi:hypothetical protein
MSSGAAHGRGLHGGTKYEAMHGAEKVAALNALIAEWREPGMVRVRPAHVVPDTTNRENTGISAMHVHYIAASMARQGFTPRDSATGAGHDLPILVRETTGSASALGAESLQKWCASQARNSDYPPSQPWTGKPDEVFFCSLGNGHFFQALNLFGSEHRRKFDSEGQPTDEVYSMQGDPKLAEAVALGVDALVLRQGIPKADRKFVTTMLNSTFEYLWAVDADGTVRVDQGTEIRQFTSFDGLTKHSDSFQLDEIIEMRLRHESEKRRREKLAKLDAALEAKRQARQSRL